MSSKRWPGILCALTVFLASIGSVHAHVHLCFDGQEPPASIYGADHDEHGHGHHELERDSEHDDLDVDLQGQAVLKSFAHDLFAVAALPVQHLAPVAGTARISAKTHRAIPRAPPLYARPLLRGPPHLQS
jgi:hypothetical protein